MWQTVPMLHGFMATQEEIALSSRDIQKRSLVAYNFQKDNDI
jgi:hypothetical protein